MANPTGVTVVANPTSPSDPHDMERRRQIALRALSERLAKQAAAEKKQIRPTNIPVTIPQVLDSSSSRQEPVLISVVPQSTNTPSPTTTSS